MNNGFDVAGIENRARTAGYQDGLLELFAAAVLASMALMWMINPALIGVGAALIVLSGWRLVERVKQKVTYPRIGYYQERPETPETAARGMLTFMAVAFALMVGAVVLVGGLTETAEWRRAAPLMSGLSLAGGFWYTGDRSGFVRHRLVAVYSVATGVALWYFGSGGSYEAMVWHLFGLALPLVLIGAFGLLGFLRNNPVPDGVMDG